MDLNRKTLVVVICVGAFVLGTAGGVAIALHYCLRAANGYVGCQTVDTLGVFNAALRRLDRGDIDGAEKLLRTAMFSEMNTLGISIGLSDYWTIQKEASRISDGRTRILNSIGDYCDRVRIFDQKDFNSNRFNVKPSYELLQNRKTKK